MAKTIKIPVLAEPVKGRICWSCEHVHLHTGSPGYSEYTPGDDMELSCGKQYWDFDNYDDGLSDLKAKLMSAEQCADFTKRANES